MYKVMVVDNEAILRKGILCLIDWNALGCEVVHEAMDGIGALEYLEKTSTDVVITDIKMPEMDGIELARLIQEKHPYVKVIILTAYPDFTYAHSAIKYNVVDFVIKTGYVEKLPGAVQKAINLLKEQEEKEKKLKLLQETLSENKGKLFENFVKDIINGVVINTEQIDAKFNENGLPLTNYFAISYEVIPNSSGSVSSCPPEDQNRFILSVKNFLSLAFKDYRYVTVIMDKSHLLTIITFEKNDYPECSQKLLMTCNEILSMVKDYMNFATNIGISGMHHSASELIHACNESLEAHSANFYNENHLAIYSPDHETQQALPNSTIQQYIDDICEFIKKYMPDEAREKLGQLFEAFRTSALPIEKAIASSMLLCSSCLRLINTPVYTESSFIKKEADAYKQIQQSKSLKALYKILSDIISSTIENIRISDMEHNQLVQKVNRYIQKYYKEAISLQSIADSLYVNSSYLSSLYKKETGNTIIDMLNKHRIEVAKKLLRDPSAKIYEVGLAVGIDDPKYFTHVFVKYAGMSPKQFKNSLQNL